jgi:AcrR family transcriptional regulator
MSSRPDVQARHRQRRLDTRRRILDAALALLEQQPWSEISLEQIMSRADLTRTAFYRHFDDRQLLLVALLEDVGVGFDDAAAEWWGGEAEDPVAALREGLRELTQIYVEHGRLLRAVSDAANQDPDIRTIYGELAERLIKASAERIAAEVEAGRSTVSDPESISRVLTWMNERALQDAFGQAPLGDVDRTAAALGDVWIAAIYGNGAGA